MSRAIEYKGAGNAQLLSEVTGIVDEDGNSIPLGTKVSNIADVTTQDLTGSDSVDQTKLESDLAGIVAGVNAIIAALEEFGISATS